MTVSKIIRILQYLLILALPFGVFYWMTPMGDISVGNDYVLFSIDHQLILQYALERGAFPLFAPGFAGGHSAAALTLGQLYHPLPHLAALFPGYWEGHPLEANTVLKLVSLGLCHLLLFVLLIRLKLKDAPAFILSYITVYNLRMLDMYRYGASLENYTGFILVVGAMGLYYLRPSKIAGPLLVIVSTYLLVTGGHPQVMYFGLLGAGLVGLLIPYTFAATSEAVTATRREVLRFYRDMGLSLIAGILLASTYTLPFYVEFIKENSARVARDYRWSLGYSDSWSGVLNSFFRPLYSNVHGAFGSSSLILVAALIPLAAVFQKRVPKVIYWLFGASLLVFLISLGGATPVHFAFWKVFPLANSFRTPGRINIMLPPLFLLSLAWYFKTADEGIRRYTLPKQLSPAVLIALLSLCAYVVYNVFIITHLPPPTHYHPVNINHHSHQITVIAYVAGIATLILLPLYLMLNRFRAAAGLLLCASILIQTGVQLRFGTWIVDKRTKITLTQIDRKMASSLKVVGMPGYGMESPIISEQMKRSAMDPELARFYRTYQTEPDNDAAYRYIDRYRKSTEAVAVAARAPKKTAQCPISEKRCKDDQVTLEFSSYNMVRFEVTATESGLFTVSFPYTERFTADVDGAPLPIHRANGYELGVFLDRPGTHTVTLKYTSPATSIGLLISLATLLIVAFVLGRGVPIRALRWAVPAVALLASVVVFWAWQRSLYDGVNLNTRYSWKSSRFSPSDNLAFGKATQMTGIRSGERPYDYYAGRAVDGSKSTGIGSDKKRSKQWWQVDLGGVQPIRRIVIYNRSDVSKHLPLLIEVSENGKTFHTEKTLDELPKTGNVEVLLDGTKTRYIRLKSSGEGDLSLKEVEIYGPSSQ